MIQSNGPVFINLSNHPSSMWVERQKQAALRGHTEIVDIAFPAIDPHGTSQDIDNLVEEYFKKVITYHAPTVMLQGEFLFTYRLINRLKKAGITVVAGCSERRTIESVDENGATSKQSVFEFVDFKEY